MNTLEMKLLEISVLNLNYDLFPREYYMIQIQLHCFLLSFLKGSHSILYDLIGSYRIFKDL